MAYQIPLTIKETLENIAAGRFVLPAIQRELVWAQEPERMCRLFDSILRGYPIGTFLFWKVSPEQSKEFHFYEFMLHWHERKHRHNDRLHVADPRELVAILDGQQRLTTLNIGLYGSLAHKLPRKRVDSVDAYPPKRLYLDLRYEPTEDDDLQFGFQFLSDDQVAAADKAEHHWYLVGDILSVEEAGEPIFEYVRANDLTDTKAFKALSRLWKAVHEDGVVSYFEEREQSLSKVLDIFVRVNSGGVVLTKSDLLLSIATAQFEGRDAREEIHGLVDALNETKPGFKFTKDLVLKAGLVLTDISDVGFNVENFTAANMKKLDEAWDEIERALRIGVKLLGSFGFSESSLPANSVLIPIADYVHNRQLDESYVTSASTAVKTDREALRNWTIRTILRPGIWGSALDQLLKGLHLQIKESTGPFPVDKIEAEMARRGKALAFDDVLIDELADTPYKHKRTFSLLSLLYPWVDTRNEFHVDHVFPRALFTPTKLVQQGVAAADVEEFRDKVERLGNLQLLDGPENIHKRAALPADWAREQFPDASTRQHWLAKNDLIDLPTDVTEFVAFYEDRRDALRDRLRILLGAPSSGTAKPSEVEGPPAEKSAEPGTAGGSSSGRSRRNYGSQLADLVTAGTVPPGQRLVGKHRGTTYEVTVTADGRLDAGGVIYDSPSQAARLMSGQAAVNGWAFWHTDSGDSIGDLRPG